MYDIAFDPLAEVGEPSPTPQETVEALAAFVPALRDDDGLLDVAVTAWRLVAYAQAALLEALAELHRRFEADGPPTPVGREPLLDVAGEFSPAAMIAPGTANNLVDVAVALVRTLPRTLRALREGRTDLTKAKVVVEVTASLDAEARQRVEDVGLDEAPRCSPRQLRRKLERAAIAVDPEAAEVRRQTACLRRRVEHYADPDGQATLVVHGPAERTLAVFEILDARARAHQEDGTARTLDQRRFDALYDLLTGRATGHNTGAAGELQVVMAASTLLGGDDRPALLRGYGPITAAAARAFAEDSRWRRLLTDPWEGRLLDYGASTYRPPKHLEAFVKTRDMTCVELTCDRDSRRAQLDHSQNFPEGGTGEGNLGPLCGTGHGRKTRGTFLLDQIEPGVFEWTTRLGRRYVVDRNPLAEFTFPDDDTGEDGGRPGRQHAEHDASEAGDPPE